MKAEYDLVHIQQKNGSSFRPRTETKRLRISVDDVLPIDGPTGWRIEKASRAKVIHGEARVRYSDEETLFGRQSCERTREHSRRVRTVLPVSPLERIVRDPVP